MSPTRTAGPPRVSVAVIIGAERERAGATIAAALEQVGSTSSELLIVDVSTERGAVSAAGEGATARQLELPGATVGEGRVAATRAAEGEVVAFIEDHCTPEPGWLAALEDAYARRDDAAAIGYAFVSDPGESYAERATTLAEYGEWIDPAPGGPTRTLPGNNVSYLRSALLVRDEGERLEHFLSVDALLHDDLAARGESMLVEPGARVRHSPLPTLAHTCAANFGYSRLLASSQARLRGWGWVRRIAYALAVPLGAPMLRLARLLGRLGPRRVLLGPNAALLPGCLAVYAAASLGQALGYLTGPGSAPSDLRYWELDAPRR